MGLLSAYGSGSLALVAGMRAGRCPMAPADDIGYPFHAAPQVSRFPQSSFATGDAGTASELLQTVAQAVSPWEGDAAALRGEECALIVGAGGFLYASTAELHGRTIGRLSEDTPFTVCGPHWGAALIAERFALRGPVLTASTGCSSSANALLIAIE